MLQFKVPKETYIKEHFQHFIRPIQDKFQIEIVGYNGSNEHTHCNRHQVYLRVNQLFSCLQVSTIPNMKNGHRLHNEKNKLSYTVDRCLILRNHSNIIVGAVYFRINLLLKRCLIAQIGVDKNHRLHGYGKILWHCAVFQSVLFGCTYISANPSTEAIHFFRKIGHTIIRFPNDEIVESIAFLDLNNDEAKQKYIQNVTTISENYNIEQHLILTPKESLPPLSEQKLLEQLGFLIECDPTYVHLAFVNKEIKIKEAQKALTSITKQVFFRSPDATPKLLIFKEASPTLVSNSHSNSV